MGMVEGDISAGNVYLLSVWEVVWIYLRIYLSSVISLTNKKKIGKIIFYLWTNMAALGTKNDCGLFSLNLLIAMIYEK